MASENGVAGFSGESRKAPRFAYPLQCFRNIVLRLDMDGDAVRSRRNESGQVVIRTGNHQMHIQENIVGRVNRLHHRWAEGNIIHKMAVHHIEMQPVGSRVDRTRGFLTHF